MAYVSSIERIAIREGLEQGAKKRAREIAFSLLKKGQTIDFVSEVTGLDSSELLAVKNNESLKLVNAL